MSVEIHSKTTHASRTVYYQGKYWTVNVSVHRNGHLSQAHRAVWLSMPSIYSPKSFTYRRLLFDSVRHYFRWSWDGVQESRSQFNRYLRNV